MVFRLTSPAFQNGGAILQKHPADGENLSPPLARSDPPEGTRSYALMIEDPDGPAGTFRHWGLCNISGGRSMLPEGIKHGVKTEPLAHAVNDFGHRRYDGPAPPEGHGTHHYLFRLAALDVEGLPERPDACISDLWEEAHQRLLAEAELVGTYAR
ncbi:MAG TPA: YbhB/YbcL family Raf kinase inhibitor-like protein [Roseiarcus sp.]|nr:YbhB/YbcL family Raf kinase inhibitor-like protein [Roseiarcus sp.]